MTRGTKALVAAAVLVSLTGCAAAQAAPVRREVGPTILWGSPAVPGGAADGQTGQPVGEGSGAAPAASAPGELPRGGREIFPRYRLFGYSGYPGAASLGRLGIGNIDDRMVEMEERGQAYRAGRELLPTMELIATMVHNKPGKDGMYRTRVSDQVIEQWLATARKHRGILLLNIQPGRADFLDEVKYYERWLTEPDVGVALDPEWAVDPGQVPGRVFGNTSGQELNSVAEYLSALTQQHGLPEKVMLYHQLHVQIVRDEKALVQHPGIVLVKSVDGIGSEQMKVETYNVLVKRTPEYVHLGFKLFYVEDTRKGRTLMTPEAVLALTPQPEYVLYE